jgi:uncharacterized Zn finger protein
MFDIKRWSMDVYYYTDLLHQAQEEANVDEINKYNKELQQLWEELMSQNDSHVQYLKQLISTVRDWVNGSVSQEELDQLTQTIRENVLGCV